MKNASLNRSLYFLPVAVIIIMLPFLASCGSKIESTDTLIPTDNLTQSPTIPSSQTPGPTDTLILTDNLTQSPTIPSSQTPGPFEIFITESGFIPQEITITVGSTLTWINMDDTWRAVGEAIPTGESSYVYPYGRSGQLQPGETYFQLFDLPIIWDYWCPATFQVGRVIIVKSE